MFFLSIMTNIAWMLFLTARENSYIIAFKMFTNNTCILIFVFFHIFSINTNYLLLILLLLLLLRFSLCILKFIN